ncbi:MAG: hypothetical protein KME11_02490 [Timaviella obliquedivisa GSE-PSE-MK23-08B]|jgi:hypothetical protein|nr:hypothetical protein [Timaviella obliquedivisa GSE-PSE-MK23-08B]
MHALLLPLIGFPLAIGFFYLYKNLRKVKDWNIQHDLLAPSVVEQGLESVGYLDPSKPASATVEAGFEAGVEAVGTGVGHLLESAGHLLHH